MTAAASMTMAATTSPAVAGIATTVAHTNMGMMAGLPTSTVGSVRG
jgi:hypothetical protein